MDPEQTFIRVQERFSQMLTPKVRVTLEYLYLFMAITFFCILVVMHANYVQQPGCSGELSGVLTSEAQLIQIKITSAGLWSHNDPESNIIDSSEAEAVKDKMEVSDVNQDELTFLGSKFLWNWIGTGARRGKLAFKFWKTDTEFLEEQAETSTSSQNSRLVVEEAVIKIDKEEPRSSFTLSAKETLKAAIIHFGKKWYRRISFIWRHTMQIIGSFQKLWDIAGVHLNLDIPKWMHILHLDKVNSNAVQWLKQKTKLFEPTYLYTMEKGYFLLPESAKSHHNIRTVNVSISAWHSCFGNRWQQLLINRFVGYDTILINSLLSSPGQGYLYNYQSKEFYNLSYTLEVPEVPAKFGDYLVTKCGVLMMSLFVFFTTTMSVSFTLRETQTRMLKFTVQLQHHARHRLPTFQLIFVHVIESLVFVPIMIGILFFLFEFYDDQLLAFMVLILVWLCELFTLISVRTPISMKFFPRFFLLYFLVFHIYFFSYAYGFSYLALSTTAAFMQHLILYFWNRFEVPALQRFMQNRRSQLQQHPDFHITSSTILASTLHITRFNTRNQGLTATDLPPGTGFRPGFDQSMPQNGPGVADTQGRSENNPGRVANPAQIPGQGDIRQAERGPNPGSMNSFSSLLLWILGGASSEGLNSFFSMFRDVRDQGQVYTETPRHDNRENQESERQR
ncbi:membralin-like protein At1g60995 [Cicer arietinum]|uniref:Membralin-like protein At1g60995 n=1 Tax=Cicer arietinum TaxID=3827 RepID=A0A1S2XB42_CICAR|nr:membralin-like protein At1g60995 [Cicer arietinum]